MNNLLGITQRQQWQRLWRRLRSAQCPAEFSTIAAHSDHDSVVDVGTPRHPTGWSQTLVRYHDFVRLPHRRGLDHTDSPPFRVHGLEWYLRVHPGGAASASGDDNVSLYLRCKTASDQNVPVQAEFSLALRRRDGRVDSAMSCPCNAFRRKRKGWPNFVARSRLVDPTSRLLDDDGTLTVVVGVQLYREREVDFVPRNAVVGLSRLFVEANSSGDCKHGRDYEERGEISPTKDSDDVAFSVGGEIVRAHRLILKLSAPTLAQLCEDFDGDTPVPIMGVRSSIFREVLRFAYGDDVPDGVLRFAYGDDVPDGVWTTATSATSSGDGSSGANDQDGTSLISPAIELLDAANQFGVVGLKILAETKIIEAGISISNFSDLILYADAKNCALLKERSIEFYVLNAKEVRRHPSYLRVKESASILDELMDALLSRPIRRSSSSGDDDVDYETMGVNLLRRKLDILGLDVDGSKEMLIQRLRKVELVPQATAVGPIEG
ncbi:hypothetical protein ACHAW5_009165 [Stephanodiscus triporus]|uniref:Uncharacterized protein n=1 Tax=Stephanodiscus triporus TaxID=2934178 RepID=A0ABD3P915_9STRA